MTVTMQNPTMYIIIGILFVILTGFVGFFFRQMSKKNGNGKMTSNPHFSGCKAHTGMADDITNLKATMKVTGVHIEYIREKIDDIGESIDHIRDRS